MFTNDPHLMLMRTMQRDRERQYPHRRAWNETRPTRPRTRS